MFEEPVVSFVKKIELISEHLLEFAKGSSKKTLDKILGYRSVNGVEAQSVTQGLDNWRVNKGDHIMVYTDYLENGAMGRDIQYARFSRRGIYTNAFNNKQKTLSATIDVLGDKGYNLDV